MADRIPAAREWQIDGYPLEMGWYVPGGEYLHVGLEFPDGQLRHAASSVSLAAHYNRFDSENHDRVSSTSEKGTDPVMTPPPKTTILFPEYAIPAL